MEQKLLLEVEKLAISFDRYHTGMARSGLAVIRDLSLAVHTGELVAVVGASGSGKSLLTLGILGLLPYNARMSGEIRYDGTPLTARRQAKLRGKEIALVPQSLSYLDPLMKMGPQIRKGARDAGARQKTKEILTHYSLSEEVSGMYPFELSGGMTRRTLISTALVESPKLVIADEPTPGLDEHLARRVMSHFRAIADEGAGVLLITHDLGLALEVADRIVVFYAGTTLEDVPAADFANEETLQHPYTRALWRAMPQHGFQIIEGSQPYAADVPSGCPFAPRCEMAERSCGQPVDYRRVSNGFVRCVMAKEVAL